MEPLRDGEWNFRAPHHAFEDVHQIVVADEAKIARLAEAQSIAKARAGLTSRGLAWGSGSVENLGRHGRSRPATGRVEVTAILKRSASTTRTERSPRSVAPK